MSADPVAPLHCLTFDVEEHFQVNAFDSAERRSPGEATTMATVAWRLQAMAQCGNGAAMPATFPQR